MYLRISLALVAALNLMFAGASFANPRLGPEVLLSDTGTTFINRHHPAVAYSSQSRYYLVAMHELVGSRHYIAGDKVSPSGESIPSLGSITWDNTYDCIQPAVAYNAVNDEFLVVWMYDSLGDGTKYDIKGRTVKWGSSVYSGPEFLIFSWSGRSLWTPRVAWNSYRNEYFVVWTAMNMSSSLPADVSGIRVSAAGSPLPPHTVISDLNNPHQADITYNLASDRYLVVWRDMAVPGYGDIKGALLKGIDGTLFSSFGGFPIDSAVQDQMLPAVSTNQQDRYIVVWQQVYTPADNDIYGIELNVNGQPVTTGSFPISVSGDNETRPTVAARPGTARDYFAAWQRTTATGEAIYASRLHSSQIQNYFEVAAAAFWTNESPALAIGAPGHLIVYEGDSSANPTVPREIYGRMWWPEVLFLPLVLK